MKPVLEISALEKSFGPVRVLNRVSLVVRSGVILGLAGGNGAGKSTLARCVSGHVRPDSGAITTTGPVAMIPQEFMLVSTMKVYENLFLGRELRRHGLLDRREMIRRSADALGRLNAAIDPAAEVNGLSVASRQKVELAKALLFKSSLLILDEPTTVLNREETAVLFALLRDFRADGGAVIYVSHRLHELTELCNEVAVMRDGSLVFQGPAAGLTPREIAEKMVGRKLDRLFPARVSVPPDTPIALEAVGLSAGRVVRDVSFQLRKGEILGLTGLAGAGRTELAETLCGVRRRTGGTLSLDGRPVRIDTMHAAQAAGLAYLPEDRQGAALLLDESVTDNVVLGALRRYAPGGIVRRRRCAAKARHYVRDFQIRADGIDAPVRTLSGGNQQKVALAKGLDTEPRIFIFDEPTRGVDVGARAEIYAFIHRLAASGVSCLLISSDLEEVIGNCSRTLVMRGGALAGELSHPDLNEAAIMFLATGVHGL